MIATAVLVSLLLLGSSADSDFGIGKVLTFPAPQSTSTYVIMENADLTDMSHEVSICGWVRPAVLGDYVGIFSYATGTTGTDANTIIISPNKVYVHNTGTSATNLEKDVWSHLCLTWDYESSKVYAYINGALVQSNTTPQKPIPSGGTIVLGQEQASVGGGFNRNLAYVGDIYDLNVLDKRLTDSEVEALYNQGFCGSSVKEDFSDRIVVSWEDLVGAPRYGGVTVQLAHECVIDRLQSKLAEKEKLLNDTLKNLLDTKVELNSTKLDLQTKTVALNLTTQDLESTKQHLNSNELDLNSTKLEVTLLEGELREANIRFNSTTLELNSTKMELKIKTVALNSTQQELETAKMRLNSSSCNQKLTEAELDLSNALEELSKPVSHWDILLNQEYFNKKLTESRLEKLKSGWQPLEDFVDVNITENVIQHFKTYHADDQDTTCSTTCDCDCDSVTENH